jgi:hypothetical protein
MGISLAVALAPEQSALASGRVVAVTSFAVLLAPLTVGTLADQTSLTIALGVVPIMLVLAAAGLTLVWQNGLERVRSLRQQMRCSTRTELLMAGQNAHTKRSLPIIACANFMSDGSLAARREPQSRRRG